MSKNIIAPATLEARSRKLSQVEIKKIETGGFIKLDNIVQNSKMISECYQMLLQKQHKKEESIVIISDKNITIETHPNFYKCSNEKEFYKKIDYSKMGFDEKKSKKNKNPLTDVFIEKEY